MPPLRSPGTPGRPSGPDAESHRELILEWRQKRNARLASDFGWLSLVGLEWLQEGENRVGSAEGNAIRLSGGPDYWGSVFLEDDKLRFIRADNESVMVDDAYVNEVLMVPDTEGSPTIVQSGTIRFYPIFRGSYALRSRIRRPRYESISKVPVISISSGTGGLKAASSRPKRVRPSKLEMCSAS